MDEHINDRLNQDGENLGDTFALPAYVIPVKEQINFTKAESAMAFVTAALAFFFVHLVLWNVQGFFTTLFYIAVITAAIIFLKKSGCNFSAFHKLTAAVLYIFSFVFSVTANTLIKGLDVIFLFAAGAYFIYSVCSGGKTVGRFLPFEMVKCIVGHPFAHFGKEYTAINSAAKKTGFGSNARLVIVGLVLALPLTLVVGALLMSADSGVEKILLQITDLIHAQNVWTLLFELALSVPAGGYLFSMLYSNIHKDKVGDIDEEQCEKLCKSARKINNTVVYTAVTPICLLYLLFFFSQANYFLSAFAGDLPENYSYAQYARQGFFELFAISVINAAVIFFISFFSRNCGENKPKALKFYTVLISVFNLLITATAISKMVMYIGNYGLTQLRVYTTWFMALLAVMFVFVIIRQFKPKFNFMSAAAAAFTLMFAILCFSRPDAVIARYNLENCSDSLSYYDIIEMSEMSDDAVNVILDDKYSHTVENAFEMHLKSVQEREELYSGREYYYSQDSSADTLEEFRNRVRTQLESSKYARFNLSAIMIMDKLSG